MTNVIDCITKEDIDSLSIGEEDFILFKTRNSFDQSFNFDFIYLAEDAAKYLTDKNISGVGIDALGIERNQEGHPTHDILLGQGIIILEGLNLKEIEHDVYEMVCLPLYLDDVEALPVRVLLKK
jgi:arylformamidase